MYLVGHHASARPGVYPERTGQAQGKKKPPEPGDQPHHVPSFSGSETHTGQNEEFVIASMKLSTQFAQITNAKEGFWAIREAEG